MLTQHKILSTFLVLLFIFAVSQLLAVFTLLNQPVRRALPEHDLAFEPYPSIVESTPELDLARLMAETQTPSSGEAPEELSTIAIPTVTLSQNTTAADSHQPDHLVIYPEPSSATDQSLAEASQGCAKMLAQWQDESDEPLNQQLCLELFRDEGDQMADPISDTLVSFSLLSNNSHEDAPVYEFTNLSAGHYFAIFYEANQVTWQTPLASATPSGKSYMVRFWQPKKKPQAPEESTGEEARGEETKQEPDSEANGADYTTNQETEETNEWASEANDAHDESDVNRADETIDTISQEADQSTTESTSYSESSDVETMTTSQPEEPNEWSSEVEVNGVNGYPAPITSDDVSQEGTTEWYYESYRDGDSYEWSWWEEESGE